MANLGYVDTYSFFTKIQRKEIVRGLEVAYHHLIDQESRVAYNESLVRRDLLTDEHRYRNKVKAPIPLYGNLRRNRLHPRNPCPLRPGTGGRFSAFSSPVMPLPGKT